MHYPICVNLRGKLCLVVGAGEIAERKVESLLAADGRVKVVSPEATPAVEAWGREGKIAIEKRLFQPSDLTGVFMVFAATDDRKLHEKIFRLCEEKNILLNVVDVPDLCNFIMPSVLRRGELMVAVSTNGASPALSKKVRRELEKLFGDEYELFLEWMKEARTAILKEVPEQKKRQAIFQGLVDSPVLELLKSGKNSEAEKIFKEIASSALWASSQ